MPLISTRQLAKTPVKYGQQSVGRSVRVWFDLNTGQALGLFVKVGAALKLLPRSDARLDGDIVAIANKQSLQTISKASRADLTSRLTRHVLGAAVETKDGRRVGVASDLILSADDWRIGQLIVQEKDGERLLSRHIILELRDDVIIVSNEVLDGFVTTWSTPSTLELVN